MLFPRLIPVLLVKDGGLQKSTQFDKWKYVGDALNAVKIFNDKDVDELLVLDVDATRTGRGPDFGLLRTLAAECFMPVAYGGGIDSADVARRVMDTGIEKVVMNAAAAKRPALVGEVASVLGASSTVVSLDVGQKKGRIRHFDYLARRWDKVDPVEQLRRFDEAGAGEVIVQSNDRDGMMTGPDLDLVTTLSSSVSIPLVYAGGVASLDDCVAVWSAGASGVAAGAWFVFRGPHRAVLITYPQYDLIAQAHHRVAATEEHHLDATDGRTPA